MRLKTAHKRAKRSSPNGYVLVQTGLGALTLRARNKPASRSLRSCAAIVDFYEKAFRVVDDETILKAMFTFPAVGL